MRYSLFNRFEGAWLGGMLGEALAQNNQQRDWLKISNYQPSIWIQQGRAIAQSLCDRGRLEEQNEQETPIDKNSGDVISNSNEAALIALPIILFYHESFSLLTAQLRQNARYWQYSAVILEDILIWGYILTLALREKLGTKCLIDQILVGVGAKQTPLIGQLKQIKTFLSRGRSLEKVVEKLSTRANYSQIAIALAIYCFATTPEDFYLCVRRASSLGKLALITTALTGMLAGAYNGIAGIPLNWYIPSRTNSVYQAAQQQAKLLCQVWSGIYQPDPAEISWSVVASPKVIQSRSSLSIISQKE
ncbi:ADP-ribosylglycohydrolase family protein [Pleurocapsales cyanobacterium LEGE 06147]|nr:ADP-ribosylglycohydrolase family protein [Pleurocapsales cyanobacterium LEGE 06147]